MDQEAAPAGAARAVDLAHVPARAWEAHYPQGLAWRMEIPVAPLPALLEATAQRWGDRPAFDFLGARMSWREVASRADRIAAGLQRLGLPRGARIALMLPNCPAYPLMFFGALKAGLVVLNCNPLYTERELDTQLRDAQARILVTPDLAVLYPKVGKLLDAGVLDRVIVCPFAGMLPWAKRLAFRLLKRRDIAAIPDDARHIRLPQLIAGMGKPAPVAIDAQNDIAVLQYTGGTSGTPKGAMLTHANLSANAKQVEIWFTTARPGEERILAILPFFHVFALNTVLLYGVLGGHEIIMLPRFELDAAMRVIARQRPTVLPGVPTLFNAIAQFKGAADLRSIRHCISGGAPLPGDVKQRFEARTSCTLIEGYGLSEASPVVCANPPDGLDKAGSIGLPMPGTDVELRDLNDPRQVAAAGARGELCVRGPQVMRGYWNRPEESAGAFIDGWLRTGDVATMDEDGYFFIVDRIKDVILAGGYNVYPRIVEEAIYRHPDVAECTVIGVPDPYRGETVKAFVVRKPGASLTEAALISFLRSQISPIELPRQVEFRDTLPKTLIGKLSKKELVAEEKSRITPT